MFFNDDAWKEGKKVNKYFKKRISFLKAYALTGMQLNRFEK